MLRHACGFKLANDGHDTRSLQAYLGHKNIQHTVRYTELAPTELQGFLAALLSGIWSLSGEADMTRTSSIGRRWTHKRHSLRSFSAAQHVRHAAVADEQMHGQLRHHLGGAIDE